jgi:quinol-cytochrome oxidoreductase complex cytochrome b subunit
MISGIVLIFAVPMILAALLISPTGFHNLIHGVPLYAALGLLLPVVGWRTFVIEFAFPRAADTRLAAVIRVWVVGTVMVAAVFNLLMAVLDYSPARPGPNPTAGFLLAGFVLSMFVSFGVWGALSPILPRDVVIRGALVTGCLLFAAVATLDFLLSR